MMTSHRRMVSLITGNYTVCPEASKGLHKTNQHTHVLLILCEGNPPVCFRHKRPIKRKAFPLMTLSYHIWSWWLYIHARDSLLLDTDWPMLSWRLQMSWSKIGGYLYVRWDQASASVQRYHLTSVGISIVEIRRSCDRLIATMGLPTLVRRRFYIESESLGPVSVSDKTSYRKPWRREIGCSHRFEIWQAHRQQCCRGRCEMLERSDNSNYKSCGFKTLRDLTIIRLIGYIETRPSISASLCASPKHTKWPVSLRERANFPNVLGSGLDHGQPRSCFSLYETKFCDWHGN